ncbi:MAG: class I SAM-dependent methyltransferase [Bacteroidales bacterium]|nr:class I SAM-dependent methyltransferase [Bacteroidales bacterium]
MKTAEFIELHRKDDVRTLALQAKKYPDVQMTYAIEQIAGWQTAQQKLPTWAQTPGVVYPHHLSMEQCSSEATAQIKARILSEIGGEFSTFVDLTAGFGVDFTCMARRFRQAVYVEQQQYLCEIAQQNLPLLGLPQAIVHQGNGMEYLQQMQKVDWIFLDPARRDAQGGKVVRIEDCEPDVTALEEQLLQKAERVMVKLSPMLDISQALQTLKHVVAVYVIAQHNECKELLLILGRETMERSKIKITSINNEQTFTYTLQQEESALPRYAQQVGTYLYEPNAALIKSGAYKSVACSYGVGKLHISSHLYTSEEKVETFPGRVFKVQGVYGFGKKDLKDLKAASPKANLSIRNFPSSVAELRKRLKINDGGENYLFATTLNNSDRILVLCCKA